MKSGMKHVPHVALLAALAAGCAVPHPSTPIRFDPIGPPAEAGLRTAQQPQQPTPPGAARTVSIGLGYTDDPDTVLLAAAIDFPVGENWTAGPALQVGVDDHRTLLAPVFQAKRFFPVKSADAAIERLLPYVQGGAGIVYLDDDRVPDGDDDVGLLLQVGGGLRYRMTDTLSLGTQMQFNFVPADVHDERFYFAWEVVQFVFAF
jgi:hypothetical protein